MNRARPARIPLSTLRQTLCASLRRGLAPARLLIVCVVGLIAAPLAQAESPIQMENNALLHAQRGQQMLTFRRWDEAAAEYRIALSLNPYSPMAAALYHNLGVSYRNLRSYSLAIASAQRAILMKPMTDQYYRGLIDAYQAAGFLTLANERLARVVVANPLDAEAWYLLALARQRNDDPVHAQEAFARFMALVPQSDLAQSLRLKEAAPRKRR